MEQAIKSTRKDIKAIKKEVSYIENNLEILMMLLSGNKSIEVDTARRLEGITIEAIEEVGDILTNLQDDLGELLSYLRTK